MDLFDIILISLFVALAKIITSLTDQQRLNAQCLGTLALHSDLLSLGYLSNQQANHPEALVLGLDRDWLVLIVCWHQVY